MLLIVLAVLTSLFASGVLRFGISGTTAYVVYVLLGLLAAVVTFGMLSNTGSFTGEHGGGTGEHGRSTLKLGGAVVALVIVAGGGALYERWFHVPEFYSIRLNFYVERPTTLQPLSGTVTIYVGTRAISESIQGVGSVLIDGIPSDQLGRPLNLSLATEYEIDPGAELPVINRDNPMMIRVRLKQVVMTCADADLALDVKEASANNFVDHSKKNLVLKLRIISRTNHQLAINDKVKVALITSSASPLKSYDFDIINPDVIPPRRGSYWNVDGLMDKDDFEYVRQGGSLQVTITCENPDRSDEPSREFSTIASISGFLRGSE